MHRTLSLLICLVVCTACASRPERPAPSQPPAKEQTLGDVSQFFAAISAADTVVVYEGLPHPRWERDLHVAELKRPNLVCFLDYPFYAKPLTLSKPDTDALTALALNPESHAPFSGYKLCGGFHPDYAIVWTKDGKHTGALICFGCHEWKLFTPDGRLYKDIAPTAYADLKRLLAQHRLQRPQKSAP